MNGPSGAVYPDSSFDVAAVPVTPGTNTLTAIYVGPAFTNVPMTATDTSTVVLGDTSYTHDANGNLTSDAIFLYQYDLANQLTNVVRKADNSRVLSCRYDALGRRVEAIRADGTTDRYVYFPGSFLVLAVLDETNTPKELYTRGPDLSGTLDKRGTLLIMPADFAGRKHIRVRFRTDLVCASEANRVMHSVEWGFEYQLDAKGNSHVFLINNN